MIRSLISNGLAIIRVVLDVEDPNEVLPPVQLFAGLLVPVQCLPFHSHSLSRLNIFD